MARFGKLEFNKPGQPESPAAPPGAGPPRLEQTDWMKRAEVQRRSGLYENALKYYSRALEQDRSLVDAWLGQVQMLVLLEEHPEAELWARKALELFPSHGDLMAGRAQALCRMKDLKRAYALCDGALKQSGQSAYRWVVRGEIMVQGRQSADQHCFDKAQQIDSDWLVPLEIALICLYYRNPTKALARARRAVELGSDQYYAWFIQGRCQRALGLDAQAKESFRRCIELCPGHTDAKHQLRELERFRLPLGGWLRRLFRR